MNLTKRRKTIVANRDYVHKNCLRPLLDEMELLKPEYVPDSEARLYEMTMKKRSDTDKIAVTIAIFGEFISFSFINLTKR